MHLYDTRVFEEQKQGVRPVRGQAGKRLRAIAAVMLTLAAGVPPGFAQQQTVNTPTVNTPTKSASDLPAEPSPVLTDPLDLRAT
jgi:hypothetical protein